MPRATITARTEDRRKVPIPAELRESLRQVFELVGQARDDPDIELDYDDAIQTGAVCGARYGSASRPWPAPGRTIRSSPS